MSEEQEQADMDISDILARQRNEHIPESIMEAIEG